MSNQGKRKYDSLDIPTMMATLTLEKWKFFLERACNSNNIDKLIKYRYGLQSGLADASSKGLAYEKMDIWVLKRCRDVERCMRLILKRKHKNPLDKINPMKDPKAYIVKVKDAKKQRDLEFERFLQKSSF